MRWPIFVAALTLLAPMMLFASEDSKVNGSKVDEKDATTQSVRDRGRILLKRNFLASEFQASEPVGFYQESFFAGSPIKKCVIQRSDNYTYPAR